MKKYIAPCSAEIELLNEAIIANSNTDESMDIKGEEAAFGVLHYRRSPIWDTDSKE